MIVMNQGQDTQQQFVSTTQRKLNKKTLFYKIINYMYFLNIHILLVVKL